MTKKVLIVDDDIGVTYTVKNGLGNEYDVTAVNSGKQCFELLENNEIPNLILLDIMMPDMSGWEVHKRIRENPNWKNIPIIFLTARTDQVAKNAGGFLAEDYIEKPFKLPELKNRIDRILNQS